jgi:hypothetical protein
LRLLSRILLLSRNLLLRRILRLTRLVGIRGLLHGLPRNSGLSWKPRLSWKHWLRLIRIYWLLWGLSWNLNWLRRLLGLIGIGIRGRLIVSETGSGARTTGSDNAIARPAQSHVQGVGRLRIRIVGITWL